MSLTGSRFSSESALHRAIKPSPHHLRDAACIIAIGLVDLRL